MEYANDMVNAGYKAGLHTKGSAPRFRILSSNPSESAVA